ncbi:zf-HC2 domain-containing protein [Candidatus Fermentibacteria bacterium]|nr:zf-HC2 domain-containing protein [Candidatus Fermentibacteria bacterium]
MTRDTMSCRVWLDMLADYLDGRLAPESKRAFQRHADACTKCAPLLAALRDGESPAEALPDLTEAVLARTSGPACGVVERTLASREVAHLDMEHHAMVRRHLEHCPSCRALEAVLNWIVPLLPAMAEAMPDRAFAADVIQATSRARGRQAWWVRVGEWWEHFTSVPLFELQAAYVGAALLVVVGVSPLAPIRGVEALLSTAGLRLGQAASYAEAASAQIAEYADAAWSASAVRILEPVKFTIDKVSLRYHVTATAAGSLWGGAGRFVGAVRHGDFLAASAHARGMRNAIASFWKAIRYGGVPVRSTGADEVADHARTIPSNRPAITPLA